MEEDMTANKPKGLIILFTAILALMLGNYAWAATMAVPNDRLHFIMGDEGGLFESLTGPTQEVAVPFSFYFDEEPGWADPMPTGEVTKISFKANFIRIPPGLTYKGCIVDTDWQVNQLSAHDPVNGIIALELYGASGIPIPTSPVSYIALRFEAYCQPELNVNSITFEQNTDYCYVETYDNGTTPWGASHYDDGTVTTADYVADFDVQTTTALLGDSLVRVEITGIHNFNLVGFDHQFTFDSDNLTYSGYEMNPDIFPPEYGCASNPPEQYCYPEVDGNTIHFPFLFNFPWTYFTPPNETEDWYYAFYFNLNPGQSDNSFNFVDFDVENSLVYPFGLCMDLYDVGTYENGGVQIPLYTVEFKSELQADYIVKGQPITYDISMSNNFPAGDYSNLNNNGAISIVYTWPDIFTYPTEAGVSEDPLKFLADFHTNGAKIYRTYQVYDASETSNFMPPTEEDEFAKILTLECTMDTSEFIMEYENRLVSLNFRNSYIDAYHDWRTFIEDTTGYAIARALTGEVSYVEIPAEVSMGRFYMPYATSSDNTPAQAFYLSSNFDVGQFSVNVKLLPNDDMRFSGLTPEMPGVEYESIGTREIRIFYDGSGTFMAANGDAFQKIATIHYRASCDGPGKITAGKTGNQIPSDHYSYYYEYGHVSLINAVIYDDAATPVSHYVDVDPHNVVGKCTVNNHIAYDSDPDDDWDYKQFTGILPTEYRLYPNSPNPFNPQTVILYDVSAAAHVNIQIINILGQHVATLVDGIKSPGRHEVTWNGTDQYGQKVSSGIYLYVMQADEYVETRKMILMK